MRTALQFFKYTLFKRWLAGSDGTEFVIVFLSRTGSNLLTGMLNSHPDVLCHEELFNPIGVDEAFDETKGESRQLGEVAERDADPWRFLNRVYSQRRGHRSVGFKLSPGENKWALLSLLLTRRIKKIVLHRRNWLDTYVSLMIAHETRMWIVRTDKDLEDKKKLDEKGPVRIEVDPTALRRFVRKRRFFHRLVNVILAVTFQKPVEIDYESIKDDGAMDPVLSLLRVEPSTAMKVLSRRQNPQKQRDKIANWDELCGALAGTEFEGLLGDKS